MPLTNELRLTVAGLTVAIALPQAGWKAELLPRLGKFASHQPPDLSVVIVLDPNLAAAPGGEPRVAETSAGLSLRHDNFAALLPPHGPGQLTIFQAEADPLDRTYVMVVDSFLRLCIAQLLADRGGLMFHASGIAISEEAGYMFFGPSGAGKTTVCRLSSPRYRILCDELVAVAPTPTGYRLYGTPFNGAWGDSLPEDVPLRELFYLRQAPHMQRMALPINRAFPLLLESAVVYHQSARFVDRVMGALLSLMAAVPVSQLEFEPKESLWETVLHPTPNR